MTDRNIMQLQEAGPVIFSWLTIDWHMDMVSTGQTRGSLLYRGFSMESCNVPVRAKLTAPWLWNGRTSTQRHQTARYLPPNKRFGTDTQARANGPTSTV